MKEGYLDLVSTASKMPNTDEVIQVYKWGPRADSELEPRNVLEFMSKVTAILLIQNISGWSSKFGTTKCRTTDISKCCNFEY